MEGKVGEGGAYTGVPRPHTVFEEGKFGVGRVT